MGTEECNSVRDVHQSLGWTDGALEDSDCRTLGRSLSWFELIRTDLRIRLQHRLRFDIRNPSRRFFYFLFVFTWKIEGGRICLQGWGVRALGVAQFWIERSDFFVSWADWREKVHFAFVWCLFICLLQVLVVVPGIFSCTMWDGIWFPEEGLNPGPPALGVQSPSHGATREMPKRSVLLLFNIYLFVCSRS